MPIQEVSAAQLAELFHPCHQALGPDFGRPIDYAHQLWKDVPQQDRSRMLAAARRALMGTDSMVKERQDSRRYFAKPGEAEGRC
jgi:hypothetical protein